jgi:hypothetical protein
MVHRGRDKSAFCAQAEDRPQNRCSFQALVHQGPKERQELGRLLEFPVPQAVASVTPPWDPDRKFGAMVRRRPTGIALQKAFVPAG